MSPRLSPPIPKRRPARQQSLRPARPGGRVWLGTIAVALVSAGLVLGDQGPLHSMMAIMTPAEAQLQGAAGVRSDEQDLTLYLVRSTLMALDDANRTGHYNVLHAIASPSFQRANPPGRLAAIFQGQRQSGLDLSIASLAEPEWQAKPSVDSDGRLQLSGHFRRKRDLIEFKLGFEPVKNTWRLFALNVVPREVRSHSATADAAQRLRND